MNMMRIIILSLFICNISYGQIKVNRNFNLELAEKDSIKSMKLEKSLNAFLTEAQNGTFSNEYTDSIHLKKYGFFFNKLLGFGKNSSTKTFNNPIIIKSYSENEEGGIYFMTISLSGVKNDQPFIYRIFEIKAVPYKGHYRFYSPFKERTEHFKSKTFKTVTYYYNNSINEKKAKEFSDLKNEIAKLTNTKATHLDYYKFNSLDELLKSYGLIYSASNCNFLCYDLGFTDNEGSIYMTGTNNENYIFGYLGDYLYYNLPNQDDIYWAFVNGLSTYYGGYGLSYESVEELKRQFREELKKNPDLDFLVEFKKGRKSTVNNHFSFYVMSSFLCQEIIQKKGFDEVLKLIYSGEDGEKFFKNLKDILGIDESSFHKTIIRLINE